MQRRITVNGTVYSVFKGTFARVVRRTPKGRPAGWEVRITDCGIITKKIFSLTDLRTANDYARTAENERLFSQGATIRDADRAAVNEYRRWEQAVRETGRHVPSLLELVIDARRNYERRAAAATWEAARDAYVAEKSNAWTPTRKSQIERFFARFTAALPNPAALLDDISAVPVMIDSAVRRLAEKAEKYDAHVKKDLETIATTRHPEKYAARHRNHLAKMVSAQFERDVLLALAARFGVTVNA